LDIEHLGPIGTEVMANVIFDIAINHADERRKLNPDFDVSDIEEELAAARIKSKKDDEIAQTEEFQKYLQYLSGIKESIGINQEKGIGAIVVNCNPFTLGHQFLIEYAADQVDLLYIFVVEENLSEFSFEDRLELVKAGTEHLENVRILPSGRFIISNLTFPDYFGKGKAKNVSVDVSTDVGLFADYIAPALGITKRFVGTEPNCVVTRQYNDYMREYLLEQGMDFIEIERKEIGDAPISASRVRELLAKKNYDEVAKIVPKSTLEYLRALIV